MLLTTCAHRASPVPPLKNWVRPLALAALMVPALAWAQDIPQLNLQRTTITAGMHLIDAQVAQTPEQREIGLMQRKEMPQREGMIFIFDLPGQQCFWMKNTVLPLTAAFVADDGTIVNMADMKPQTTDPHCSAEPVRYVLEMNRGWFAKKGIKAGSKLGGPLFDAKRRAQPRAHKKADAMSAFSFAAKTQAKLAWAKSQLTRFDRKVSTNLGRWLR